MIYQCTECHSTPCEYNDNDDTCDKPTSCPHGNRAMWVKVDTLSSKITDIVNQAESNQVEQNRKMIHILDSRIRDLEIELIKVNKRFRDLKEMK